MDPALVERLEALGYLNDRAESAGFRPPAAAIRVSTRGCHRAEQVRLSRDRSPGRPDSGTLHGFGRRRRGLSSPGSGACAAESLFRLLGSRYREQILKEDDDESGRGAGVTLAPGLRR